MLIIDEQKCGYKQKRICLCQNLENVFSLLVSCHPSQGFEKPFDNDMLVRSVLNLLHDEMDIQEDLPDPESVLKLLSDEEDN